MSRAKTTRQDSPLARGEAARLQKESLDGSALDWNQKQSAALLWGSEPSTTGSVLLTLP